LLMDLHDSQAPDQILLNNEGTEDGSLIKLLSRCITPFGAYF